MKQFIIKHKYAVLIFIIFLIVSGVSGYYNWKISNKQFPISNEFSISNSQNNIDNSLTVQSDNDAKPLEQLTTASPSEKNEPLTNQTLPATSYQLEATTTSTVLEVMQLASADSRSPFLFETKTFTGIGEFVESINDLKNNSQTGEYWIYYINGESAQLGISQQIVKPGDVITWKYEKSTF